MKKLLLFCGILAIASVSCVKKEFDLNQDLDLTVRIGGDVIFVPIGITDSLFLRDFLDADSIDMLEILNGGYAIIVGSELHIDVPEIGNFEFDVEPLHTEIDLGVYLPQTAIDTIESLLPPGINLEVLNTLATTPGTNLYNVLTALGYMHYFPLPLFAVLDTVLVISISEQVDNDHIISIDTVWLQPNSGVHVVIKPLNIPSGMGKNLDSLLLKFPSNVHLDISKPNVVSRHEFMITDVDITAGLNLDIPILYFTDIYRDGSVELTDSITVFVRYNLVGEYDGKLFPDSPGTTTRLSISIIGGIDINFSRIYANVLLDESISISLNDLPDILMNNRDNLVLDVSPHLGLIVNTNLQVPHGATITLKSYKNNSVINTLNIPINLNAATENRLWIARDGSLMPEGYTLIQEDLGSVVRSIPDSVVVRVGSGQVIFDFNETYFAGMDYEFVVPLAFGEEFQIIIQDTFKLDSIIGKMISGNKMGLAVRALNDIPLDLTATVIPIDENNNPLSGVEISPFVIRAGTTMDDEPAELIFDDKNSDQLANMRGLVLRFEVRTGAGKVGQLLRPDNFIQVRLNARIEGGVTIDVNDFFSNNDNEEGE